MRASSLSSEEVLSEVDRAEEESSRGLAEIQRTLSVRWRHSSPPPSSLSWYWPAGRHASSFRMNVPPWTELAWQALYDAA